MGEADALQLAAALVLAGDRLHDFWLMTLDQDVARCAQKEDQVLPL